MLTKTITPKKIPRNIPKALKITKSRYLKEMTDEEILTSPEMVEYLTNLAQGVTGVYDDTVRVTLIFDETSSVVAYMNKHCIVINAANELIKFYDTLEKKIMCTVGLAMHECSHKNYLNIDVWEKANEERMEGKWPHSTPSGCDPNVLVEIEQYIRDEKFGKIASQIICKMAWDINNIFADVNNENRLAEKCPGLPAKSFAYPLVAMYETIPVFEDEIKKEMDKTERLSFIFALILRYARFHDVKIYTEDCWENEFVLKLVECMDYIEDGIEENDDEKRQTSVNEILAACWPYIKDVIDEMKEKSEKRAGGSADSSDNEEKALSEALKKILDALEKCADETKSTVPTELETPKKKPSTSEKDKPEKEEKAEGKESKEEKTEKEEKSAEEKLKEASKPPKISDEDKATEKLAESLKEEIAERKAEEEEEKKRTSELSAEIKAVNARGHEKIRIFFNRKGSVTKEMIDEYNKIAKDLLPVSKAIQRQIRQIIKDRREGGRIYGEIYGKRFEERSITRIDGRYFSKTKLPIEAPRLAVAVLIDESGSMSGEREIAARKMAILCEDFTRGLEIPTLICGHSTIGAGTFALYSYVEFDKIDNKDRYRLVDIHARSQNRDGLALKIMCERLVKRPEEIKLLIVVSDGQPADYDYGGISAEREMQEICLEYRKKGIAIFAAAIGNDKENIHRIYKDGYLDISDLTKLPKQIVGLIKKHIKY